MKTIIQLLFVAVFSLSLNAQVANVDLYVIHEGKEDSYLKLEEIWKEFHQEAVDNGEKLGWAAWKVDSYDGKEMKNTYAVFNLFESEEQMKNANWDQKAFMSIVKRRLKGKMSSSYINKITRMNVKKESYSMQIKAVDLTPLVGGDIKVGDKAFWNGMVQLKEDYEQWETEFWKPIVMKNVMEGRQMQWVFTKVLSKNEAMEKANPDMTHVTWNFLSKEQAEARNNGQSNQQWDFTTQKLFGLLGESVKMQPAANATLVMATY